MTSALPVTIIGGFLGSGKTTLVNHLLRHANGVRLAVLVNDFGDLAIDAALIEGQDGDVINLSGGCVCCSYGDDLSLSLKKLQEQPNLPDHIFIEASGVALPGAIGKSLLLLRAFTLEGIVVLADAATIESAAAQKYIGDTIERQLIDADLIVLNKLDLISDSQAASVRRWLDELYPLTPHIDAVHSTINPEVLFSIERRTVESKASGAINRLDTEPQHHAASLFSTLSVPINHVVDANWLAAQLADKKNNLVRAKGFVLDTNNELKTIQVVGRRWSVTPAPAGVQPGLVCIAQTDQVSAANIRSLCDPDARVMV